MVDRGGPLPEAVAIWAKTPGLGRFLLLHFPTTGAYEELRARSRSRLT